MRKTMKMPKAKREMRKSGQDNFAVKKTLKRGKQGGPKASRDKRLEKEVL
jgi:hypothetical protein